MDIGHMAHELVRDWDDRKEGDWDYQVADGGSTFGMLWEQHAYDTLKAVLARVCMVCEGNGWVWRGEEECDCRACNGVGFMPRTPPKPVAPVYERPDGMPF